MDKGYIKRELEELILRLAGKFPIITVLGPRQSGKTTLLKHLYPSYAYVTLEAPDVRLRVQADPRGFLDQYKNEPLIIDEFQRFPDLVSYLQEYADAHYQMGQVFLTGSQQYEIAEKVSQSLAGRTAILKLLPLSLAEITNKFPLNNLGEMMFRGSYPAVYHRKLNPSDWYPSYVETYLERDVRKLLQIGNLDKFALFLHLLAGRAGQLMNLNNLSREAGITQPTARQWFSILQASQLIFSLKPLHRNINKRILKTPKLYFNDTGMLCYLLGLSSVKELRGHPLVSAIFENFVISEFVKFNSTASAVNLKLLYYRDKNGREVDFILERGNELDLFEIKYTHTIRQSHFKHLKFVAEKTETLSQSVIYAGELRLPNVIGWKELRNISGILKL